MPDPAARVAPVGSGCYQFASAREARRLAISRPARPCLPERYVRRVRRLRICPAIGAGQTIRHPTARRASRTIGAGRTIATTRSTTGRSPGTSAQARVPRPGAKGGLPASAAFRLHVAGAKKKRRHRQAQNRKRFVSRAAAIELANHVTGRLCDRPPALVHRNGRGLDSNKPTYARRFAPRVLSPAPHHDADPSPRRRPVATTTAGLELDERS